VINYQIEIRRSDGVVHRSGRVLAVDRGGQPAAWSILLMGDDGKVEAVVVDPRTSNVFVVDDNEDGHLDQRKVRALADKPKSFAGGKKQPGQAATQQPKPDPKAEEPGA
jgi:hypothetical protein